MIESFTGIIGVFLGFLLAKASEWYKRRQSRKAHWNILAAEVSICAARARNYINRSASAPLYRLPTTAFGISFPVLVGYADVSPSEFKSLIEYYSWCEDINRGLDRAGDAFKDNDPIHLSLEENRIDAKCKELLSEFLESAVQALEQHGVSPTFSELDSASIHK